MQAFNDMLRFSPELTDAPIRSAVHVDNPTTLVKVHVVPKGLKLSLELQRTHAVARTENRGLTHETLVLVDLVNSFVVDAGGHLLIHVVLIKERLHKVLLPRHPRQHPSFDLS